MSAQQKDAVFESATLDWAAFDEPLRRAIYDATRRGLIKSRGPLWWTFTPLTEPWMYTDLINPALSGDPGADVYLLNTWANAESKGGYLPDESIKEFADELSEIDEEVRIYGRPKFLTGRIYPGFDRDKDVLDTYEYSIAWPMWEGVDPHLAKPHAWMQVVITPDNDIVIVDEIYSKMDIHALGDEINARRLTDTGVRKNVVDMVLDTPGKILDWGREISPYTIFAKKGIHCTVPPKVNRKEDWVMAIAHMLREGKIKVMAHCTRTITELENYRKDLKGNIVKDFDDMMDILGYIVTMNPKFQYRPRIISYRRDDDS